MLELFKQYIGQKNEAVFNSLFSIGYVFSKNP